MIVKFSGNYHGHVDSLLVAAGSSAATLGVPNSPGVTAGTARDTLVLPYNDPAALEEAFARDGNRIAAVILEPVVGNMGCVVPTEAFRIALTTTAKRHGALLICDEVMTGFRVAYGGAQSLFGLKPDLTTLGKVIGGGLPVGAYGGAARIMDHILPAGKVFQAGTLSGNPLATTAGIATLKILRDSDAYARLERLSQQLADGLTAAARAAGVPHTLARVGSMMTLFFNSDPVTDWESAARSDTKRYARFFWGMLDRGVYLPCSQFEALFVSTAHTSEQIAETVAAAAKVFATL
jgi:glutamate-1-semialdehyde 2,1-aminomutase